MVFTTNEQLIKEYKKLLMDLDVTQKEVALRLGMIPQSLQSIYDKKGFAFVDMQRFLDVIGYELVYEFRPKEPDKDA